MTHHRNRRPTDPPQSAPPLDQALDRSEHAQGKVEQAAADLSSVNAGLSDGAPPLAKVARALQRGAVIEVNVLEASAELVAVNEALADEVVERKHLEEALERTEAALAESRADAAVSRHSALHDTLTGLANATLFQDRLEHALAQAERHLSQPAVMFIDLDGFKEINDTRGHGVGDRVLQTVARRLDAIVRSGDTVSRRGGDEFLFLLTGAKDESNVDALVGRIAQSLGEIYEIDGAQLSLSASIGVARYPEHGRSAELLLKHADAAMYAAKKQKQGTS